MAFGNAAHGSTSLSMSTKTRDSFSDRIVTVLHKVGRSWHAVVVQADGGGVKLLEARTAEHGPAAIIDSLAAKFGRGRILRIVPGAASVCRVGSVGAGNDAETLAAMGLISEAILPSGVPAHRRGAGVLTASLAKAGATPGSAPESRMLATAWIGSSEPPETIGRAGTGKSTAPGETWITEVGALAGALTGPGLAVSVDVDAGTVGLLACGQERSVARQLLGDKSSTRAWQTSVEDVLQESAVAAGIPLDTVPRAITQSGVYLPPDSRAGLRSRVQAVPTDDRWIEQYGLCLAAALVAVGSPTLKPLSQIVAEAPKVLEPVPVRAAGWIARPNRAKAVLITGIAILLLGPVAFTFARHSVLKVKNSDLQKGTTSREQTLREAALYAQLENSRWPVTKLLGDVSTATPVGVVADSINISTDTGLRLAGRADSQEQVNALQANLNATKLFRNVKVGRTESLEGGAVEFDLTADVVSPHNKVTGMEDFAAKNLAVRLYGEGADNFKEDPPTDKSKSRRPSRANGEEPGKEGSSSTTSRRGGDEGPPPALSDAEINKLDSTAAAREFAKRRSYVQKNPTLDTATKDRLNDEVAKLRERIKKAQSTGGTK